MLAHREQSILRQHDKDPSTMTKICMVSLVCLFVFLTAC